jgi:Holliday junction resolvase
MAATPEKKVKDKCVAQLKAMGAVYFYPVTGGYGTSGVSDIIVCHQGRYIAIECKAGKNKLSELQKMFLEKVQQAGGVALVINEENVMNLTKLILDSKPDRS